MDDENILESPEGPLKAAADAIKLIKSYVDLESSVWSEEVIVDLEASLHLLMPEDPEPGSQSANLKEEPQSIRNLQNEAQIAEELLRSKTASALETAKTAYQKALLDQ